MIPLYAFLAVVAGAAIALQGVLNTQLREQFTLSLAVLWNATFFLVLAVLLWLLSGLPWITRERLAQTPTHLWLGGACGFAVVVIGALVFARLSATWTLSLLLLGQFAMAMVIDAYGLFGMEKQELPLTKWLGLLLIGCGVLLFRRS